KYAVTRRDFLKRAGLVTAAGVLAGCVPPDAEAPVPVGAPGAEPAAPAPAPEIAPGVPRHETLILENPTGRVVPADDFNRWRPGIQSASTGLQQLSLDALWYIDPDAG